MQADLANLVGSRICHDLISPIGAISNGVELMALTAGGSGEEMALIKQSVESAAARIKFFRIAYGAASADHAVSGAEIRAILDPLGKSGRITFDWQLTDDVPRDILRCVFLMAQALETSLPLGGTIMISGAAGDIVMTATGRRISLAEDLWHGLTHGDQGMQHTAAQVQFALLPPLLAEAGRAVAITLTDDRITAQF